MRAQSLRKTIGLVNVVLVLAVVGGLVWYFALAKPAAAQNPKSTKWVDDSWKQYEEDRKRVVPAPVYPLKDEKELNEIRRPDIVNDYGVWPYVGAIPIPMPKKDPNLNKPPEPEGIDAIGKPFNVWMIPGRSSLVWKMNSGKLVSAREGQFLTEKADEKDTKGRFKIKAIEMPDPDVQVFSVVYEVYDDPGKPPTAVKKGGPYDLTPKRSTAIQPVKPTTPAGPTPAGTQPGTPGAPPGGPTPPAVAARLPKVEVKWPQPNVAKIEFDDAFVDAVEKRGMDDIVKDVATEDVPGGGGVRFTKIPPESAAAGFEVQQGDKLKSINGTPVHSRAEAINVVKGLPKDIADVVVVIERNAADLVFHIDPRRPNIRGASRAGFEPAMGGK